MSRYHKMKIHIIRGQNQIGGSIIEVRTEATRVVLDVGCELGEDTPVIPQVDGLFQGKPCYHAVFVTHYHGDHIGLLANILSEIPVYMGEKATAIYQTSCNYLGRPVNSNIYPLFSGKKVAVGEIEITPFLCDHSAFDSYMLLLESEGMKILYTGDFRANGRKSFSSLMSRLPLVDILITEGTTLSGKHRTALTEQELEEKAVKLIAKQPNQPVFVFMAATNIDRLVTIYRTAKRTKRIFLQDVYTASIAAAAGKNIPNPEIFSDVRVFLTVPNEKQYTALQRFPKAKIGRAEIAKKQFVMCVRPSMKKYLERLFEEADYSDGLMFYSMWDGYVQNEDVADFLQFMEENGIRISNLHTSGHADEEAFDKLIEQTCPKYILPVHTENAAWFERYTNCNVLYESENTF